MCNGWWIVLYVGFLNTAACATAVPASGRHPAPEQLSASVSVSGLDLTTPEGARIAHERVRKEALRLCRKFSDSRKISDRETVADCMRQATDAALERLRNADRPRAAEVSAY